MLFWISIFLIGFGLAVAGGINIIIYLNLLLMGNSYSDYFLFIMKRPECYLFIIGLIMITVSIYSFNIDDPLE